MKKIIFALLLLGGLFVYTSCDDDDQQVDLPTLIDNYLASTYPDYTIDESETETLCDGTAVYEVEIENGDNNELELTFDMEGSLLFTETEIDTNDLPAAVTNSISTNYVGYDTKEAERLDMANDSKRYEVELKNGSSTLEVLFEADGTVVCEGTDDD